MAENVRVAVRVRPFNGREKARSAVNIITMTGNTTEIKNPNAAPNENSKKFTFDFSYWSHDGFIEREDGYLEPENDTYADQKKVFNDLGVGILENTWKGYNCSLFAYGQTGSGKSYSIVGYGANKGVVPVFCEELFKEIDEQVKGGTKTEYQVTLSMLEIYNEQVRDLLNPASNKKGGLKVREHKAKGFYVESLVSVPVKSYVDIDRKIQEGTKNRTVASTNMNATSSRAHTIVAITLTQKALNEKTKKNMTKTSIVNLVDLAGSERADSTGATGDRLKEGSSINQSLSTLGNVIKALADQVKKKVQVPYRDSVLTKLLKNALGGNSKTIMIAALSPADINYEETLSTLRFADRAKAIKTKAVINESPTDKLIRELREENAKLMEQLKKSGGGVGSSEIDEAKHEMEEQLRRNQQEMEEMKKSWEQRLAEAEASNKAKEDLERKNTEERKSVAHLWNLNEDPVLTNMVYHFVRPGIQRIGKKKDDPPAEIILNGLSIQPEHAVIVHEKDTIRITPCNDAKVVVNGKRINDETILHHHDRILFGSNHMFVLHHPTDMGNAQNAKEPEKITYEMAQEEIVQNSGFDMDTGGKSKEDLLLQEDLLQIMPMVNEANAMSEELNKKVKFEVVLISPQARGQKEGRTDVSVKMKSLADGNTWLWDRNKFLNRKYLMQEMYQNFVEGESCDVPKEKDPFWEPADADVLIGSVHVYLQSLAYKIELDENLQITDYKGNDKGRLKVQVFPCDSDGNDSLDDFKEDPAEMIGQALHFNVRVLEARGLPQRFSKGQSYCKYKFYLDKDATCTNAVGGTINPDYNHRKKFSYNPVTKQFVQYLLHQPMVIEVWGRQGGIPDTNSQTQMTTKQLMTQDAEMGGTVNSPSHVKNLDEKLKLFAELQTSKKKSERMEKKLKKIEKIVDEAKAAKKTQVEVRKLEEILKGNEALAVFKAAATVVSETRKAAANDKNGKVTSAACSLQ